MELTDGISGQLGEEETPYIVEEQIQPLSTILACIARYYRARDAVLPRRRPVLPWSTTVLPWQLHRPEQA